MKRPPPCGNRENGHRNLGGNYTMKYVALSILFLFSNEILTLVVLCMMMLFFIGDILKARVA